MNCSALRSSRRFAAAATVSVCLLPWLATACSDEPAKPVKKVPRRPWVEPVDPVLQAKLTEIYEGVERPDVNVLLISLDSLRSDFMSTYGHVPTHAPEAKTTPAIDKLAEEGVVFENFKSNTSWTLPSHMSMMTGEPDIVHSVIEGPFALDPTRPTIASVLRFLGYATAGFYTGPFCHERFGFHHGMDRYEDSYGPELAALNQQRAAAQMELDALVIEDRRAAEQFYQQFRQMDGRIDAMSHRDVSSGVTTDKVLDAIDKAEAEGKPWFVFGHYFDPHYDYMPPPPYDTMFDPEYKGEMHGRHFFNNQKIGKITKDPRLTLRDRVISDRDLEHILALYEGDIAWTDSQLGRLFDTMREKGVLDDTLIIITADHGDEFFEHGGIGHRSTLFEEQLAVPLIIRFPNGEFGGQRLEGLASHPDIFPTILDVLSVPQPEMNSSSVMPMVRGESDGSDRHVLAHLVQRHDYTRVQGPRIYRFSVWDAFYKGSLKITRVRQWRKPKPDCPPERAQKVLAQSIEGRNNDWVLHWIDLEQNPMEEDDAHSSDFSEGAPAAALAELQELYRSLKKQERPVSQSWGGKTAWVYRSQNPNFRADTNRMRQDYIASPPGEVGKWGTGGGGGQQAQGK